MDHPLSLIKLKEYIIDVGSSGELTEAETIVACIVGLTVLAGVVAILEARRPVAGSPVPLVVYTTLVPIVTFVIVASQFTNETVPLWPLLPVAAPLPVILLNRRIHRAPKPATPATPATHGDPSA